MTGNRSASGTLPNEIPNKNNVGGRRLSVLNHHNKDDKL